MVTGCGPHLTTGALMHLRLLLDAVIHVEEIGPARMQAVVFTCTRELSNMTAPPTVLLVST